MKAVAGDTQLLGDGASKQSELVDAIWSFPTVGTSYRLDPTPQARWHHISKRTQCNLDSTVLQTCITDWICTCDRARHWSQRKAESNIHILGGLVAVLNPDRQC